MRILGPRVSPQQQPSRVNLGEDFIQNLPQKWNSNACFLNIFVKFYFFSSLFSKSHFFIFHKNCQEWQKNVFDQNFNENLFLTAKFNFSEPPRTLKRKKSTVNNITLTNRSRNPKTYWPFWYFSCPLRPFWHYQSIDLDHSSSEHFFWLRCGSYSVPNDHFCFVKISSLPEKNPQTQKKS